MNNKKKVQVVRSAESNSYDAQITVQRKKYISVKLSHSKVSSEFISGILYKFSPTHYFQHYSYKTLSYSNIPTETSPTPIKSLTFCRFILIHCIRQQKQQKISKTQRIIIDNKFKKKMNFIKTVKWAKEANINNHYLGRRPTKLYEVYAKECSLNERLKIYKSNESFALWMLKWTKFSFYVATHYIDLVEFDSLQSEKTEFLDHFLDQNKYLQGLSVYTHNMSHKVLYSSRKFHFLNELSITICEEFDFSLLRLPSLEKIEIILKEHSKTLQIDSLKINSNLKSISIGGTLNQEVIGFITSMQLQELELSYVKLVPKTKLPKKMFFGKNKIVILTCQQKVLRNFLSNCIDGCKKLTIETTGKERRLKFKNLRRIHSLKFCNVNILMDCINQYENLSTILKQIPHTINCHWHIQVEIPRNNDSPLTRFYHCTYKQLQDTIINKISEFQTDKECENMNFYVKLK